MRRATDIAHAIRLPPLLLGVLLAGVAAPAQGRASEQVIAIVVDRDNPKSDIGAEELRSLFLGKRGEWPDGMRAVPVDVEAGPLRRAFCSLVMRMSEAEYDRYWVDQRVRGAGAGPRSVSSVALVVRLVARVRGAVGYVPWSRVDGTVKVLSVGGIRPGQNGYPLVGDAGWPGLGGPGEVVAWASRTAPLPPAAMPWITDRGG